MKKLHFLWLLVLLTGLFTLTSCGGVNDEDDLTYYEEPDNPSNGGTDTYQGVLQLMRTCVTCSGNKACTQCNGTGKGCPTCRGTGRHCKDCGTTGICQECRGTKKCSTCSGDGIQDCSHCTKWPGHCSVCDGTGLGLLIGTNCDTCKGTGECKYCSGTGNTDKKCWYCDGSGKCSCGDGTCPTCHGNPTCSTCGGDGHCLSCNGSCKCSDCKGTGEIGLSSISSSYSGGDEKVIIHSTAAWDASVNVDWIKLSRSSGTGDNTITVTIQESTTTSTREGVITFTSGNCKAAINVFQWGEPIKLIAEPSSVFVYANGTGESISITSNTSWSVWAADSWLTCSPSSGNGNATITVSASAYSSGTRYTTLTFTDETGNLSAEVSVIQAESPEALTILKNMMEKPLGIVDVSLKTASYQEIRDALIKLYKISVSPEYKSIRLYAMYNPSLCDLTYQGMAFSSFRYDGSSSPYVTYDFRINKSVSNDYKSYLNNILQDFKYNMNVLLIKNEKNYSTIESYTGYDADRHLYFLRVWDNSDDYSIEFGRYY